MDQPPQELLLRELVHARKPVLLKRGISATIEEWLLSAEYVLSGGNTDVILCERGIRTFETATRNTFDISAIPVVKKLSHLPVIADPSHGTGKWHLVAPMARAAVAAGADGLIIEVHPNPDAARSDIDATIGRGLRPAFSRISSRQTASEADADPPGLSMRSTIARTEASRLASRMCSMSVSDPSTAPLTGSKPLLPFTIAPAAYTTAMRGPRLRPSEARLTCAYCSPSSLARGDRPSSPPLAFRSSSPKKRRKNKPGCLLL